MAELPVRTRWWQSLGPGLVTGAADDDPSGIATYTQAGAQFGYGLLWTLTLAWPLMMALQLASARLGWVSGRGIATSLRRHYPQPLVLGLVGLLAIANVFNIGADLAAMVEVARLLTGVGAPLLWLLAIAGLSLLLEILVPFARYAPVLKLLTLSLLSYAAVLTVVQVPWSAVVHGAFASPMAGSTGLQPGWNANTALMVCAVLGTTISPYLFFWQASHEAEDIAHHRHPTQLPAEEARRAWAGIRLDTFFGMTFSVGVAASVMIAAAATLYGHGGHPVATAGEAALALRPVAGDAAFLLFALGILGAGLLAVPVLAGSAAYALAEALHWRASLELRAGSAPGFYSLLAGAVIIGALLQLLDTDPLRMLFWAAVINGLVSAPVMVALLLLVARRDVMGSLTLPRPTRWLGWTAVAVMTVVALTLIITTLPASLGGR